MSFIDVAIPGIIGIIAFVWPTLMFLGSRATPSEKKIRVIRYVGVFLLLVAAFDLVAKFAK